MSADRRAAAQARQILPLLRLRTKGEDGQLYAPQLCIESEDQPIVPASVAKALHCQHHRQNIGVGATILLGYGQPLEAELGTLPPVLSRELAPPVALNQTRIQFLLRELDHRLLER